MTKKDYIKFAALLQKARMNIEKNTLEKDYTSTESYLLQKQIDYLRDDMITMFMADNPRFDGVKFAKACEV